MIEVKGNEVTVNSELNDFIDVTFIINGGDEEVLKASKALECAVENWFDDEDAEDMCYGDYFELLLDRAGVKDFETVYNYKEESEDNTTQSEYDDKESKRILINEYIENVFSEYFEYEKEKPRMRLRVEIYQKKELDLGFHNASDAEREFESAFKDYEKVYEGIIDYIEPKEPNVLPTNPKINRYYPTAECVFNTFQHGISENIPKDYNGRSLSSGDVVCIRTSNDNAVFNPIRSIYYCMSVGFYKFNMFKTRKFAGIDPFQE